MLGEFLHIHLFQHLLEGKILTGIDLYTFTGNFFSSTFRDCFYFMQDTCTGIIGLSSCFDDLRSLSISSDIAGPMAEAQRR